MEVTRYIIRDTRLGLSVTARSLESARLGAEEMNRTAGYTRFVVKTISALP